MDSTFIDLIPQFPIIPDLDQLPTFYEVCVAVKGLKNNKAAGPDGLPAEVFKHGGYLLKRRLHHFITSTWSSGCVTHKSLFFPFIDLTKAFDAVNRDLLWKVLSKFGCSPHFLQILREFHDGMSARVTVGAHELDPSAVF